MTLKKFYNSAGFVLVLILCTISIAVAQNQIPVVKEINNILPLKEQADVMNSWLEWRLENILPRIMKRVGIDMWIVVCREYNEDPVYLTLMPEPSMAARRKSILIFYHSGKKVERFTASFYGVGKWYKGIRKDKNMTQLESLADFIKEKNPKKIGLNYSEYWAFADGLTVALKEDLVKALGKKMSKKIVPAVHLSIGWLETRSPMELSIYRHICGVAHDIIKKAFSNKVIIPDVTTTEDVVWWLRQKISDIGIGVWFHPTVAIQRSKKDSVRYKDKNSIIRRGDILHSDVGITYMGLNTDTQQMAYVCRIGESEVPAGLKVAMKQGNRLQDILMKNFKKGWSGNKILIKSLKQAASEQLIAMIYSHPIGMHGHAAGPTIGLWNRQEEIPVKGDYPLYYNTCYAIELNVKYDLPEWNGQRIRIAIEEDAAFTENGCNFIDGRQTEFHLIK